ncbi:MAG: DNA ligase [Clostridiales Family XIII bacterium]|nr:DNA ligase [Clostridiales Family XIII bacterium]
MSKMSDMAMTIEELRNAAAAINDAADWLSRQFSGESEEAEPAPAKEPELKLEDVRTVLADMSRKGHTSEIRALLQKYGAAKLSGVDPAKYSALLKDVEGLDHAE